MKKLFVLVLCMTQLFVACKKEETQWVLENVVYEKISETAVKVIGIDSNLDILKIPPTITVSNGDEQKEFKVLEIAPYACMNAYIRNVFIPNTIISIGKGAFYGCFALEAVVIGTDIKSIGEEAFFSPNSINNNTNYIILALTPPNFEKRAIDTGYIHVKNESVDAYNYACSGVRIIPLSDEAYEQFVEILNTLK